jgi:hypothetical protein
MTSSHHEFGAGHAAIELPSNRSFGTVFAVAFAIGAAYLAYRGSLFWIGSVALAAVFAISGLRNSAWLTPLNVLWMKLGLLIGLIMAPIALGILFFLVIAPLGITARAFGKDFLRIKPDTARSSYWIHRIPPGPDGPSMNRQF